MAETVEERRARLRALREAATLTGDPENGDASEEQNGYEEAEENGEEGHEEQEQKPELPPIRFRNYLPRDEELQKLTRGPPVLPKFDDPVAASNDAKSEDPMLNIAPKKANWDLRRDVAKKLEKLEKRTTRAIIELMPQEEEHRRALLAGDDGVVSD